MSRSACELDGRHTQLRTTTDDAGDPRYMICDECGRRWIVREVPQDD